jgi:hypothetical protein
LKPKKRKIAPQTTNVAGVSHNGHVACGAKAVAASIPTPITAIIPPATDIHRRRRAWCHYASQDEELAAWERRQALDAI